MMLYFSDLSAISLTSQCDGVGNTCKSTLDVLIFSAPAVDNSDPWVEEWSSEERMCCTDATAAAGQCFGAEPNQLINPPGLLDAFKRQIVLKDGEVVALDDVSDFNYMYIYVCCFHFFMKWMYVAGFWDGNVNCKEGFICYHDCQL